MSSRQHCCSFFFFFFPLLLLAGGAGNGCDHCQTGSSNWEYMVTGRFFYFPCLLVSSSFSSEVYQMSFTLATYVIVFFTVPLSF